MQHGLVSQQFPSSQKKLGEPHMCEQWIPGALLRFATSARSPASSSHHSCPMHSCYKLLHTTTCYVMSLWVPSLVSAFVKGSGKDSFPRLQVRYKKGASPTLKLLDDTNTVQDTLAWVCVGTGRPASCCLDFWYTSFLLSRYTSAWVCVEPGGLLPVV